MANTPKADEKPNDFEGAPEMMLGRAAKSLFEIMEFLDPSEASSWDDLPERIRDFYRLSVAKFLEENSDMLAGLNVADHHMIRRRLD